MLVVNSLGRIFVHSERGADIELADPAANLSPEAVLNFYAQTYPVLTTAKIEGPEIVNDKVRYKFVSTIGTKG
jgi:PRTRC genetic system protein C